MWSIWNANITEIYTSAKAVPPPHGIATESCSVPFHANLNLITNRSRLQLYVEKTSLDCLTDPLSENLIVFFTIVLRGINGQLAEMVCTVLYTAEIAPIFVTLLEFGLHSLHYGF